MAEVSIKQDKRKGKILKKFSNKLDKVLIIDKSDHVIKLKQITLTNTEKHMI